MAAIEGKAPGAGGAAGGDLAGSYPNPEIAANAVGPGEVQNPTRSVNLPLGSFLNQSDQVAINYTAETAGARPNFELSGTGGLVLTFYDDADFLGGDVGDVDFVASTLTVPADYASGGQIVVRASKPTHAGIVERVVCSVVVNGAAFGLQGAITTSAASTPYAVDLPGGSNVNPGDSVTVLCSVDNGIGGGTNYNDFVRFESVALRYTATQ